MHVVTSLPTEAVAPVDAALLSKLADLERRIAAKKALVVAYSGGVDSALVCAVAMRVLGPWDETRNAGTLAVLADSATLARSELRLARATADTIGVPLHEIGLSEFDNPDWAANRGDRCYHCKKDLAAGLDSLAPSLGVRPDQVAFGVTTSDQGDHRPGIQASAEAGVWHPLVASGLSKPEVRALARHLGLPVWDKPATPCLSSRVQYGERITPETLARIERAEEAVRALGFRVFRVRHHDRVARLEVPHTELERALQLRDPIVRALKESGYTYVTLDLVGFRSGAMNEALSLL